MKIDFSNKKRVIAAVCLAGAALAAVAGGTLAIYGSQTFRRAVVRNRDSDVIRFSSDRLWRTTKTAPAKNYHYLTGKNDPSMTFTVCNYDQIKSLYHCEADILYDIQFDIQNGTSGSYTLSVNRADPQPLKDGVPVPGKLSGNTHSTNSYTVYFSEDDYDRLELTVTVTPRDLALTNDRILKAKLIPIKYASEQGFQLTSEFPDSVDYKPSDVDAYKLQLSISGGKGDIFVGWDSSRMDIDPFLQGEKKTINGSEAWRYIQLEADSDVICSYLIPFYNNYKHDPTAWTQWNALPILACKSLEELQAAINTFPKE